MPYSDEMPALVFPNTRHGRDEAIKEISSEPSLRNRVYFCLEWEPRWNNEFQCSNANTAGATDHNLCFRCPAGFIRIQMEEKDFEKRSIGLNTGL